ncbi:alpha/beta hydrolase family protein [Bacteroides heparinolyticus]|uniref:S9 family peptidase n=1 Tax=Prevotella heparinolytica TaxID=28113 RepID=UPI0023F76087|nr:S9 family peptidase [Bacteroides heparinolyticus]MCI6212662.1 S9 family peptidase [Bacteroides heparinolyticus]
MKQVNLLLMSAAMTLASCGGTKNAGEQDASTLIRRSDIKIEGRRMTPEALWAMGRIGSVAVSPDEKQIAYTVSYYSVPQNKSNSEVFVMDADGSANTQITQSTWKEAQPIWFKDGKKLAFLSSESGSNQVWEMNPNGTERKQLTQYDGDIEGFSFSPDGKKLLFIAQVKTVKSTADKHPDLPKATGIIVNDLMYKHWDEWVTTASHPFVADFDGNGISNVTDILEGEPYESPMKPWGGIEQLAWSPASDKVAYTCRKKTGLAYAISTNSDIYIYDLATKRTINITEENKGYDTNPQYSPDGKYIAWQSMERDGYEADLNRLFIMNLETGEKRFVSKAFESNVDAFLWNKDSQSIFFIGVWHGETHIYRLSLTDGDKLTWLTDGVYDYASLALCGDKLIAKRHSMSMADEIYAVNTTSRNGADFSDVRQLTFENKHIYDQLDMGKVEPRWMTTTDGKQMLTWVIYPPRFDPNKKYPTLLFCEGGPQSPVSQFWSYRWNFQIMAANDYIIVAPNRRGLPGFGVEWNEAISGDYGGQCMKDYFTAIDEISKEPFVDKDHLGCVGASFGGFSVYWLAGHHDKRFKAFIAHDGIFNMEMQYLETEEKWFANWDMGGAYWEKNNATAQRTFANSPHLFVDKWDTPILCIHGEKDFRILANQAMAAFDAAVMRGVPAELLIYPDENHWVLKPQNGVLWQRTFFEWLDKWLKTDK